MRSYMVLIFLFFGNLVFCQTNEEAVRKDMMIHLDAVAARDLHTLKQTLPSDSVVFLILPSSPMTSTAAEFLSFHKVWFESGEWSLESEIASVVAEDSMAVAIVKQMYREPDRNGEPYYNQMITSYDLKLEDGTWRIFKDHMCSIEKSTDKK